MDKFYIKTVIGYEQTGIAIKAYLSNKNIIADIAKNDVEFNKKKHTYTKIIELCSVDCVNTFAFSNLGIKRRLPTFYFGDFSFKKLQILNEYTHVYSEKQWPIHNFIAITEYKSLQYLANNYNYFQWFDDDQKWVYQTLLYCGCKPLVERNIPILTVTDYAKELGL